MKKYFVLVKANILSTFSFLNKKSSAAYTILNIFAAICILILMAFLAVMIGFVSVALKSLNMLDILYVMLFISAAFFSLFSGIKIMTSSLFSSNNYHILSSLPIPDSTILLSELTSVYFTSSTMSFLFIFPCLIGIGIFNGFNIIYYTFSIITLLLVPMLPLIIAGIISFFLNKLFLSIPFFKKIFNALYFVVYFIFMAIYMNLMMSQSSNANNELIEDVMANFAKSIESIKEPIMEKFRLYPFTNLILKININHDVISLLLFIAINIALVILFSLIFGRMYKSINESTRNFNTKSSYTIKEEKQSSVLISLIKKDFLLLTSHNFALFQTLTGGLISAIMVYAMLNQVGSPLSEFGEYMDYNLFALLAAVISALMICVAPYTAFAISIEGKNFWIMKSSPIKSSDVFKSKIFLNILLNTPAVIVTIIIIALKLNLGLPMILLSFLIIFFNLTFETILALFFNILKPNLVWDNITKAVKSGASSGFSVLAGFLTTILLAVVSILTYFFISKNIFVLSGMIIVVEAILSVLAYLLLIKKGNEYYEKISI